MFLILGIICSSAWLFSNIASKYWQENWENHITLLEDSEIGRLYKTTVSFYENPFKPSVSRLNLKISAFITIAWSVIDIFFMIEYAKIHTVIILCVLLQSTKSIS